MVESKPAGMSPTYCLCSVGYVQEMHELRPIPSRGWAEMIRKVSDL